MSQKEFNLDVDDMCYYLESDNEYVKSCEKEFYCNKRSFSNTIGICQKTSDIIKKLGDDCTFSSQCDSGLECINKKCFVQNSTEAYTKTDLVSGEEYFYCPYYLIPLYISDLEYKCEQIEQKMKDKCYILDGTTPKKAFPDYFKVCGEQEVEETSKGSGIYHIKSISTSYIGSVEDGKFVADDKACQHGFALYFYGNKETEKPTNEDSENKFKMCVTVNEVDDKCNIKYSIGEKNDIYNARKMGINNCNLLITKLDLFQQYLKKNERTGRNM